MSLNLGKCELWAYGEAKDPIKMWTSFINSLPAKRDILILKRHICIKISPYWSKRKCFLFVSNTAIGRKKKRTQRFVVDEFLPLRVLTKFDLLKSEIICVWQRSFILLRWFRAKLGDFLGTWCFGVFKSHSNLNSRFKKDLLKCNKTNSPNSFEFGLW